MIQDQQAFQVHPVEKREVDVFDRYFGVQVFGKPARHFFDDPVLAKRCLNKYPCRYNKKERGC